MSYPLSYLNVSGKTFCCKKCDKKVTVEYEGGAWPTLLTTPYAQSQLEYLKHFDQPHHATIDSGFYLYEFGLCSSCYESTVTASQVNNAEEATALYDQVKEKRQQLIDTLVPKAIALIDQVSSEINLDDIHGAIGHPVDLSFGDKYATEAKRVRLIHVFAQKYSTQIEELARKKVFAEGSLLKSLKQHREYALPLTRKIKSLLPESLTKFALKRTNDEENLSGYNFEDSIRKPTNSLPDEVFYEEYSIDWDGMMFSLGIALDTDLGFHHLINKSLCNKIMIRLAAQGV